MDERQLTYQDYVAFARMSADEIARDCEVDVFRATGPGGQGVNTTDSAVRMRHVPTGVTVTARESRSQFQNRASSLRKLKAIFERRARPSKVRKPTKPSKWAKARRLADKRFRAAIKQQRKRPAGED